MGVHGNGSGELGARGREDPRTYRRKNRQRESSGLKIDHLLPVIVVDFR